MYSMPTPRIWKDSALELFAIDTRYFGTELYIDQYNEFGFSFGRSKEDEGGLLSSLVNELRLGVTYLKADDSEGFTFNLGYKF